MLGVYIHIPFCRIKCPYCDFYSEAFSKELADQYTEAVLKAISSYKQKNIKADTLYFGGGTPNLIGEENISKMVSLAKEVFSLENAEITMEANPETLSEQGVLGFKNAGINRLSLGLQSANADELSMLSRRHTPEQVEFCVKDAKSCGLHNISLDLMVGISKQTAQSLERSIDFCVNLGVSHISAYLLKIEKGTPYHKIKSTLSLPDDDASAELYEFMCSKLEKCGYEQYEISNFAKNGAYSRHNIKYWQCEEYIGIGAAAHGFFEGKRYYYERSIKDFIAAPLKTIYDGEGGSIEETVMLGLRLAQGIDLYLLEKIFNQKFSPDFYKSAEKFSKLGFLKIEGSRIYLTQKGFLVSNTIIGELIENI